MPEAKSGIGLAVFIKSALVACTRSAFVRSVSCFKCCITKVAAPAANGPAMDVPLMVKYLLSLPVETI